ncbi:MAG TPA: 50S ribosome-binding GTPase [Candidatus Ozemobacteraceae bacterium]|nr:50S ribosome-binding GTPase [Candidatus Ozemobacteraceae bacterium]
MNRELPGHIRKAFRSIERFIPVVDLVVELLDARMPLSSRLPGLVKRLKKPSLVILGKADLADPDQTRAWVDRFEAEGQPCQPLDARQAASVKELNRRLRAVTEAAAKAGGSQRQVRRMMVIGIPNVGKSTLINALAGRKAARVANLPGVTRDIQWIKLAGSLELLDLPGVLDFGLLKRGEVLRLINTVPGRDDDQTSQARRLCEILKNIKLDAILPGFAGEAGGSFDAFLPLYARRMNFLARGGVPDERRAAQDLVKRFQSGGFGRVTLEAADMVEALKTVEVTEE